MKFDELGRGTGHAVRNAALPQGSHSDLVEYARELSRDSTAVIDHLANKGFSFAARSEFEGRAVNLFFNKQSEIIVMLFDRSALPGDNFINGQAGPKVMPGGRIGMYVNSCLPSEDILENCILSAARMNGPESAKVAASKLFSARARIEILDHELAHAEDMKGNTPWGRICFSHQVNVLETAGNGFSLSREQQALYLPQFSQCEFAAAHFLLELRGHCANTEASLDTPVLERIGSDSHEAVRQILGLLERDASRDELASAMRKAHASISEIYPYVAGDDVVATAAKWLEGAPAEAFRAKLPESFLRSL